MAPTTDKSIHYMPLAGLASDGWSKEDEATATCFCGTVQLAFVSLTSEYLRLCIWRLLCGLPFPFCLHSKSSILSYLIPPFQPPADPRPWPSQHLRLQLFGLPQNHRVHVRIQLHRRRYAPEAPARPRQSKDLQPSALHRLGQPNDQLLLFHVRYPYVPRELTLARAEHHAHRHHRRFPFARDQVETRC